MDYETHFVDSDILNLNDLIIPGNLIEHGILPNSVSNGRYYSLFVSGKLNINDSGNILKPFVFGNNFIEPLEPDIRYELDTGTLKVNVPPAELPVKPQNSQDL